MADITQTTNGRASSSSSQLPRYRTIATLLEDHRKELTEPERLPSEEALAVEHEVARDTVRRAMRVLEDRGAVTRHRRRGTFLLPEESAPSGLAGMGVGFVPPWWVDSTQAWYTASVFGGVYGWADEHDWHLSVFHVPR